MSIEIKTPEQFTVMREAGLVVARTLRILAAAVRPGVTTAELDALAEAEIRAAGAIPSFKGYHGYPATICTSVNEEIVHGIPSQQRILREGDIISIDCGAIVRGWHGDAAVTVGVGAISAEHAGLLQACETALWRGLAQARAGHRLGDISHAVEASICRSGRYGVVEEYTGHGIGSAMHMDPPVPNYGRPGRGPRLRPGITTAELDALAEDEIRAAGATPSFKGYHGYPATICASVNDEIVHGIPSRQRSLRDGDIVSIDCGAIVGGWHGDAAVTVGVGDISAEHARLLQACETALWQGLAQARAGRRLSDISHAVETSVSQSGPYGVVEEYTGHGIGSAMHMDPPVPNYGRPGRGPRLRPGMALAIEPMVMLGRHETVLLDDGWTVVTADGSWAAHFEHTVAITDDGPWVLTAEDGGLDRLGGATPPDPLPPGRY